MLKSIIRKEILGNFLSYKFSIMAVLSTTLTLASIFLMYRDYRLARENYEILESEGAAAVIPPTPLSIFAKGLDENLCRAYVLSLGGRISASNKQQSVNDFFKLFTVPDLLYIIKVILSLCAMLFAFDMVAGEKEAGTLRQSLSGSHGRLFSQFEALGFGEIQEDHSGNPEKVEELAAADPQFRAMVDAFRGERARVRQERRSAMNKAMIELGADLRTKAAAQTRLAKNLAGISPVADYVYVARGLTGTGLRSWKYFEESASEYRRRFRDYATGVQVAVEAAHKNEPTPEGGWFLDLRDHPRFVFQEESLKGKLGAVLPYWGVLVLFNIVFFLGAFVGFMRYDVR